MLSTPWERRVHPRDARRIPRFPPNHLRHSRAPCQVVGMACWKDPDACKGPGAIGGADFPPVFDPILRERCITSAASRILIGSGASGVDTGGECMEDSHVHVTPPSRSRQHGRAWWAARSTFDRDRNRTIEIATERAGLPARSLSTTLIARPFLWVMSRFAQNSPSVRPRFGRCSPPDQ